MPRVLVTDHVFSGLDIERQTLAPVGAEVVEATATDEATLVRLAAGVDAMLVCYARVTPRVVEAAAGTCRVMARYGIGYDNIPVDLATKAGILVTNVPDYCLDEVADHTMALLLSFARHVSHAYVDVRAGGWKVPQSGMHRLRGRRLALIGTGRIGRRVAERALAFGLEVTGYDPYAASWDLPQVTRCGSLEEALAEADFVSLHAPMSPENLHLIGDRTIGLMHRAPIVINTARGGLVDLDAALRGLDSGALGGLALDVSELEPLPADHPLRTHDRAIITPHIGFYSAEAQDELQSRAADEVLRALKGEAPRCPINAEVLDSSRPRRS